MERNYSCNKCEAIIKTLDDSEPKACSICLSKEFTLISFEALKEDEAIQLLRQSYDKSISFIKSYVDLPENHYKIISLWIAGTYFHKNFNTYPFLFLNAMRGSGKTRLLKIISYLQSNGTGDLQNNISEAVLFRTAQERGLIIDEFEGIGSKDKNTLRELLNSAYKRGGKVRRMKKRSEKGEEKMVVEEFNLFTPIAMANIWGIEEVLSDRCITLILEKSTNNYITKKIENFDNNSIILDLKSSFNKIQCSLCSVVMDKKYLEGWNNYIEQTYNNTTTLHTLYTYNYTNYTKEEIDFFKKIDDLGINGRNLELFLPLILTARFLEEDKFNEILQICKEFTNSKKEDEFTESKDVAVYDFVSKQNEYRFNYVFIKALTNKFREFLGEMENDDKWLNEKWLGRSLKRLNLITSKRRLANGNEICLNVDKAKEKLKLFKDLKEGEQHEN